MYTATCSRPYLDEMSLSSYTPRPQSHVDKDLLSVRSSDTPWREELCAKS